jgi:hypothetical protein
MIRWAARDQLFFIGIRRERERKRDRRGRRERKREGRRVGGRARKRYKGVWRLYRFRVTYLGVFALRSLRSRSARFRPSVASVSLSLSWRNRRRASKNRQTRLSIFQTKTENPPAEEDAFVSLSTFRKVETKARGKIRTKCSHDCADPSARRTRRRLGGFLSFLSFLRFVEGGDSPLEKEENVFKVLPYNADCTPEFCVWVL